MDHHSEDNRHLSALHIDNQSEGEDNQSESVGQHGTIEISENKHLNLIDVCPFWLLRLFATPSSVSPIRVSWACAANPSRWSSNPCSLQHWSSTLPPKLRVFPPAREVIEQNCNGDHHHAADQIRCETPQPPIHLDLGAACSVYQRRCKHICKGARCMEWSNVWMLWGRYKASQGFFSASGGVSLGLFGTSLETKHRKYPMRWELSFGVLWALLSTK